MPLIEIKNASKGFGLPGQRSEVLKDINLSVEEGEFVVIVGYSGTGKTTFARALCNSLRVPLVISSGAGSASQNAIGTGVAGGMISGTVLAVFLVPVFFVVVMKIVMKVTKNTPGMSVAHAIHGEDGSHESK